jgi:hypothetical protein
MRNAVAGYQAWMDYMTALTKMSMSANEVIWRRTQQMATGAMTPAEAAGMILEKSTAAAARIRSRS